MEIIRHTSLGKMIPCRSAQCNHSYCVSCSTSVLVILVILIVLLTPAVETGVWGRGDGWGVDMCTHVYARICLCMLVCACVHSCMCTLVCICT